MKVMEGMGAGCTSLQSWKKGGKGLPGVTERRRGIGDHGVASSLVAKDNKGRVRSPKRV
jgi:hypothetical protein